MIKTAIKHVIYEFCIDKIFQEIRKNFPVFNDDFSRFSIGDFVQLKIYYDDFAFIDLKTCRVVYKKKNNNLILVSHDLSLPIYLIIKDGKVSEITHILEEKEYSTYF